MPAGVTWTTYLKFASAALISMLAGSQTVHVFYKPLDGLDSLVEEEVHRLRKELVDAMEKGDVKLKNKS